MVSSQLYLNGALFTHFSYANFQSKCYSRFLFVAGSERLYSKATLSYTRKALQFPRALQTGFSEKIENVPVKYSCRCSASVMLPCNFIKTGLHHGYFLRNTPSFFGIAIWLVSQIIIVLIGLRKGNFRSVIREIL